MAIYRPYSTPWGDVDAMTTAADPMTILYVEAESGAKGLSARDLVTKVGFLDSDVLSDNLAAFCKRFSKVLASAADVAGGFRLESFEVTVDVTARGEIRLISSVSSEIHGGIKLIFTRGPEAG